jgi:hypothetical protein
MVSILVGGLADPLGLICGPVSEFFCLSVSG